MHRPATTLRQRRPARTAGCGVAQDGRHRARASSGWSAAASCVAACGVRGPKPSSRSVSNCSTRAALPAGVWLSAGWSRIVLDAAHRLDGLARHQHEVGARGDHRFGRERPVAAIAVDRVGAAGQPDDAVGGGVARRRPAARRRPSTAGTARAAVPATAASFAARSAMSARPCAIIACGLGGLAGELADRLDLGDHAFVVVVVGQDQHLDAGRLQLVERRGGPGGRGGDHQASASATARLRPTARACSRPAAALRAAAG